MNKALAPETGMEEWLATVARRIAHDAPDLNGVFEVYAGEARFGRQFIANELQRLPSGARVLEIGAGSYLLSCQLVREGFEVSALEPVGLGFSHFHRMQDTVAAVASDMGCMPTVLALQAENLEEHDTYEFAFSINVMEHVHDVGAVIGRVSASLRPGACYRFTCPNYLFPYEPHFNMPTLLSKRLTERCMGKRIFGNGTLDDPAGTWQSLNWITVGDIARVVRQHPELRVTFGRDLLTSALERVVHDPQFAARRAGLVRSGVTALVRTGLHRLPAALPASILPIIDCRIEKTGR